MNLDEFLDDLKPEIKNLNEAEEDTEKFIKNIDKVRLNQALKNVDRISAYMMQLASGVRGIVKTSILQGAVGAFKRSRDEAAQLRRSINDNINQYVNKTIELLGKAEDERDARNKLDKNAPKFENIFEKMTTMVLDKYDTIDDGLVKRSSVILNPDKLDGPEEKKYNDLAGNIVEFYVREVLKIRTVLSTFQTFLARVRNKTEFDDAVMDILPRVFKSYIKNKFGTTTGQYLVAHIDKWYHSTNDRKEAFKRFENLINRLLGVIE